MTTVEQIILEIANDVNMEVVPNDVYDNCYDVYHDDVFTDMIMPDTENSTDEVSTVTLNNGHHELQIPLPVLDDVIGHLYQRIDN